MVPIPRKLQFLPIDHQVHRGMRVRHHTHPSQALAKPQRTIDLFRCRAR